jgi:hypothetical protein
VAARPVLKAKAKVEIQNPCNPPTLSRPRLISAIIVDEKFNNTSTIDQPLQLQIALHRDGFLIGKFNISDYTAKKKSNPSTDLGAHILIYSGIRL